MLSSKKQKNKNESSVSKTETRHVSQTGNSLTVHSTMQQRSQSVSYSYEFQEHRGFSTSLNTFPSIRNNNFLQLPNSSDLKKSNSSSVINIGGTKTDARPSRSNINTNYQSPYRNSPVYQSYRGREATGSFLRPTSTVAASTSLTKLPPLPVTTQPLKKLVVKKTGKFYDKDDRIPTYKTSSKNRGEVLIINNIMFEGEAERKGAKIDHERLEDLFRQMGFKVTLKKDLKAKTMKDQIEGFSKKSSLKNADISIVVIMSHGTKQSDGTIVIGVDGNGVPVEDILNYFAGDKCKNMLGKPKIFIFQCCRGDNEQTIQTDATPIKPRPLADMLIAYSTLPGFVSYRDPKLGTWYIQALCDVFSQHAHEYHVEELLKIVDVQLAGLSKDTAQTSNYESRGFKRCYLHPV